MQAISRDDLANDRNWPATTGAMRAATNSWVIDQLGRLTVPGGSAGGVARAEVGQAASLAEDMF